MAVILWGKLKFSNTVDLLRTGGLAEQFTTARLHSKGAQDLNCQHKGRNNFSQFMPVTVGSYQTVISAP